MSENLRERVGEQRSAEIVYATPPRRQVATRSAMAALVLGIISLGALMWGLWGPKSGPNARIAFCQ